MGPLSIPQANTALGVKISSPFNVCSLSKSPHLTPGFKFRLHSEREASNVPADARSAPSCLPTGPSQGPTDPADLCTSQPAPLTTTPLPPPGYPVSVKGSSVLSLLRANPWSHP